MISALSAFSPIIGGKSFEQGAILSDDLPPGRQYFRAQALLPDRLRLVLRRRVFVGELLAGEFVLATIFAAHRHRLCSLVGVNPSTDSPQVWQQVSSIRRSY